MSKILNRLCKWRMVYVGWQLGTRSTDDPEAQAVKDHRELTIMLRAEVNALSALLTQKKVFTSVELTAQVDVEAEVLMEAYEERFPGFKACDDGMQMDVQLAKVTMKGWKQ